MISNKVILYKYDKKDKKKKDKKKKEEDETEELEIVNLDCGEIRLNGDIKAEFDEKFKGALGTQVYSPINLTIDHNIINLFRKYNYST